MTDRGTGQEPPRAEDPPADSACGEQAPMERVRSEQLLQGRRMVEIAHNGEVYRLQATRLGKLILTK